MGRARVRTKTIRASTTAKRCTVTIDFAVTQTRFASARAGTVIRAATTSKEKSAALAGANSAKTKSR